MNNYNILQLNIMTTNDMSQSILVYLHPFQLQNQRILLCAESFQNGLFLNKTLSQCVQSTFKLILRTAAQTFHSHLLEERIQVSNISYQWQQWHRILQILP